jgi:hypothetical protein
MSETTVDTVELVIYKGGEKTTYSLEQGQLEAIIRVLGLPDEGYYSPELEAQDPYFTREEQASLARIAADVEAGRNLVDFEP